MSYPGYGTSLDPGEVMVTVSEIPTEPAMPPPQSEPTPDARWMFGRDLEKVATEPIEYPGAPRSPADTSWITMTTVSEGPSWRTCSVASQVCAILTGAFGSFADWQPVPNTAAAMTMLFGMLTVMAAFLTVIEMREAADR